MDFGWLEITVASLVLTARSLTNTMPTRATTCR